MLELHLMMALFKNATCSPNRNFSQGLIREE